MTQFRTVLADPNYSFNDQGSRISPQHAGHYNQSSVTTIGEVGMWLRPQLAADCALWLWIPNAMLLEGAHRSICNLWGGFVAKQIIPWVKLTKDEEPCEVCGESGQRPAMGMGHYTRCCTEMLVLCVRGVVKVKRKDVRGVIMAARATHSEKPDDAYGMIESLTDGPYLELYARRRYSDNWTAYGDQLDDPTHF